MKIINKLPHWVITNPRPAFYDTDSGTSIEQTALLYKKMQEIIESYNLFVDEVNGKIEEFIATSLEDQETFELSINQMIHDFTTLVETKIKDQDGVIAEAIAYLTDNLTNSVTNVIMNLFESQQLTIDFTYDSEMESLDISGIVLVERGNE